MILEKVNPQESGELLLKIDNEVFIREFDLPSRDVGEQINYLRGSETYLVREEGKIVGFHAFLPVNELEVEIKTMAVLPQFQGKGVGQKMMKEMKQLNKHKRLILATHPRNIQALVFYLKQGFIVYGWKDNYFGDGQPRLLLSFEER